MEALAKAFKPPSAGGAFSPLAPRTKDGRTLTPLVDSDGHVSLPVRPTERNSQPRNGRELIAPFLDNDFDFEHTPLDIAVFSVPKASHMSLSQCVFV